MRGGVRAARGLGLAMEGIWGLGALSAWWAGALRTGYGSAGALWAGCAPGKGGGRAAPEYVLGRARRRLLPSPAPRPALNGRTGVARPRSVAHALMHARTRRARRRRARHLAIDDGGAYVRASCSPAPSGTRAARSSGSVPASSATVRDRPWRRDWRRLRSTASRRGTPRLLAPLSSARRNAGPRDAAQRGATQRGSTELGERH